MKKPRRKQPFAQPVALPRRRYRFFAAITLLTPLLLFLFMEAMLRIVRFGPDLSLFREETIGDTTYLRLNPFVTARYFSGSDFAPVLSPQVIPAEKQKGTIRIFCLGASTTVGYPYWYNGSFPAYLTDRLAALFPEKRFEVINLGLTATNSHTVLDIAEELVDYEPDLFIVYDGHNEFYGALGAASNLTGGYSRTLVRAYLHLIHLKTFLFLRSLFNTAFGWFSSPEGVSTRTTLMERVARGKTIDYGGPADRRALETFNENLHDLAALCRDHNIPLVLGTQVSNLRHQPPFIAGETHLPDVEQRVRFNEAYNAGMVHFMNGNIAAALNAYHAAQMFDTLRPDLHFLIGRCLDSLHDYASARLSYIAARDRDHLRFRASSPFNHAILSFDDGATVVAVDLERAFALNSPDSLIGHSLILEHLHPNARGTFLLARAYAHTLRDHGLLFPREAWSRADTLDEQRLWEARSLTEVDELIAARKTEVLTSGWPFAAGEPAVPAIPVGDTLRTIVEEFVRGVATWEDVHLRAGEYYEARGELTPARKEYQVILRQLPKSVQAHLGLARLSLRGGQWEEAATHARTSLSIRRTAAAYAIIGGAAIQKGRIDEAVMAYEAAWNLGETPAERAEHGYLLALACLRKGDPERAAAQLREVLTVLPDHPASAALMARLRSAGVE